MVGVGVLVLDGLLLRVCQKVLQLQSSRNASGLPEVRMIRLTVLVFIFLQSLTALLGVVLTSLIFQRVTDNPWLICTLLVLTFFCLKITQHMFFNTIRLRVKVQSPRSLGQLESRTYGALYSMKTFSTSFTVDIFTN